jgi:hypothetical protein
MKESTKQAANCNILGLKIGSFILRYVLNRTTIFLKKYDAHIPA